MSDMVSRSCPVCRCSVSVPSDSDREIVSCSACGTELVTRRDLDSVDVVARDERIRVDVYDPPVEFLHLVGDQ